MDIMNSLKDTSISQIKPIPGLYISDRFAARSRPLLEFLNITHVLSVTSIEDVPTSLNANNDGLGNERGIKVKHIDLDDHPTEDVLCHLGEACGWIDDGLKSAQSTDNEDGEVGGGAERGGGVLVHCTQGISRSGAVVVAYLMRTLHLPYEAALNLARESRPVINTISCFEKQLKVWDECGYEVYEWVLDEHSEDGMRWVEKAAYMGWLEERDRMVLAAMRSEN